MAQFKIGTTYSTFAEFEAAFKQYQEENHVKFIKYTGRRHPPDSANAELEYVYIEYACRQGKKTTKSESQFQKSIKVGCEAMLRLWSKQFDDGTWKLVVKASNLEHNNHPWGPEAASLKRRETDLDEEIKTLMTSSDLTADELEGIIGACQQNGDDHTDSNDAMSQDGLDSSQLSVSRPLSEDMRRIHLSPILESGWSLLEDRDAIEKDFLFTNFSEAFRFITAIMMRGEKMEHYPEWYNYFNKVTLTLSTHDVQAITMKDVNFANYVDRLISS